MDTKWLVLFLSLIISCSCKGNKGHQMTIHGKIEFLQNPLKEFPKKSCLIVKFEDTRKADASSIIIAEKTFKKPDTIMSGGKWQYKMAFKKPSPGEYSIAATLNIGWCPTGGDKWLRNGDYLTTEMHNVNVKEKKDLYVKDVKLEHYGTKPQNVHNTRREEDPCYHAPCMNSICRSFANGSYVCTKFFGEPCAVPMCSNVYEPICADNGKTYENECLMDADSCEHGIKHDIHKVHDGECYAKRALLGGFLFGSCIVLLAIVGFFAIFYIWRRNRKYKIQDLAFGSVKKNAPLGM